MHTLDILDEELFGLPNWATELDEDRLQDLGRYVIDACDIDEASREDWLTQNQSWINLAQQVLEEKNYPWPKASAVKFPLLTTAALQFHARAHQELLKDERIVLAKVIGKDTGGEKAKRARRVEDAMSLQFMFHMEDWQDDMDRLLYVLPLVGTLFKKVYWSDLLDRPTSELVLPSEMVVGYYADNWDRARKTHILYKSHNEVVEEQRLFNYLEVDLTPQGTKPEHEVGMMDEPQADITLEPDTPHELLECHCWYDLDDDGYEEPYIITVDRASQQVLRLVPRFRPSDVKARLDGVVMRIDALEYIVPYKFFPSVDSNTYGTGFGQLLGPLNSAVNSVINQLIDAGTLANQQTGFLGRGVRVSKGGTVRFRPGEWKELSATGDDLRKGVFPLPAKSPDPVLFQLLGYLVEAGRQVSSVAEVMEGKNPGQNQPYSTTATVLDQGMQVFLGIYKRVYRSLAKEYRCVYNLNHMFLSDDAYNELGDFEEPAEVKTDFQPNGLDILPEADPNMANSIRKQTRVQSLMQAMQNGMQVNPQYVLQKFLESIDEPNIEEVMQVQPPPPSAEDNLHKREMMKIQLDAKRLEFDAEKAQNIPLKDEAAALANIAKAQSLGDAQQAAMMAASLDRDNALREHVMDLAEKAQEAKHKSDEHQQKMGLEDKKIEAAEAKLNASTNKPGA